LIDDPRFAKQADRFARSAELIAMFDAAFAKRDRDEWRVLLDEAGIVFECVAEMSDLSADGQMFDAGVLVPFENDAMLTIDSPFFVDGADKVRPRKAPAVGEHSDQILREIGYDDTVIAKLRENGIVA
jgi:crotonobetainyl-CoA:carnitine CoA-transferase CaiB-like acyl-CoA transferase